jgi:hypothetical protein
MRLGKDGWWIAFLAGLKASRLAIFGTPITFLASTFAATSRNSILRSLSITIIVSLGSISI